MQQCKRKAWYRPQDVIDNVKSNIQDTVEGVQQNIKDGVNSFTGGKTLQVKLK